MAYCSECGGENPEGAKFCEECGSKLNVAVARQSGLTLAQAYERTHGEKQGTTAAEVQTPETVTLFGDAGSSSSTGELPDEKVLYESDNKLLVVTTHRIRFDKEWLGDVSLESIMLEELSYCRFNYKSHPWLIVLAAISVAIGLYFNSPSNSAPLALGVIVALMFVAGYFISRHCFLFLFASCGQWIEVETPKEAARKFIATAEAAKNARYFARLREGAPVGIAAAVGH